MFQTCCANLSADVIISSQKNKCTLYFLLFSFNMSSYTWKIHLENDLQRLWTWWAHEYIFFKWCRCRESFCFVRTEFEFSSVTCMWAQQGQEHHSRRVLQTTRRRSPELVLQKTCCSSSDEALDLTEENRSSYIKTNRPCRLRRTRRMFADLQPLFFTLRRASG